MKSVKATKITEGGIFGAPFRRSPSNMQPLTSKFSRSRWAEISAARVTLSVTNKTVFVGAPGEGRLAAAGVPLDEFVKVAPM
jgi:predicted S18 family serine protease